MAFEDQALPASVIPSWITFPFSLEVLSNFLKPSKLNSASRPWHRWVGYMLSHNLSFPNCGTLRHCPTFLYYLFIACVHQAWGGEGGQDQNKGRPGKLQTSSVSRNTARNHEHHHLVPCVHTGNPGVSPNSRPGLYLGNGRNRTHSLGSIKREPSRESTARRAQAPHPAHTQRGRTLHLATPRASALRYSGPPTLRRGSRGRRVRVR